MFKIESYITPLLMGYIDKYVQLRAEDFQLSLWGGDVVLGSLDLRLDVIEQAIQLPIIFKSGHIHELRIHVPWTKLMSEPVVITINTIECILKVRDTGYDDNSSNGETSRSGLQQTKLRTKQKPQPVPDLPPGYLQSLVNKIVNNVNIVVNNLILKFVEDDIVLSINVKSAECYSVDKEWARAFVELSPLDLFLRKVVSFCDLTVCLDKSNSSGKIETYQDPVLYRSSITCRLHMAYDSIHAKFPSVTKLNVFCDKLDLTLTDTQLPMFIRLIQLCISIYYGTLDTAAAGTHSTGGVTRDDGTSESHEPSEQQVHRNTAELHALGASSHSQEAGSDVGWGQWAWSFVPQILPEGEEGEEADTGRQSRPILPIFAISFFIPKGSVTFKLTGSVRESAHYGPQKVIFTPIIRLDAEGLSIELLVQGLKFFDIQCGITNISITGEGDCVCGFRDDGDPRSCVLLKGGSDLFEPRPICYTSNSLFDPVGPDNKGEATEYITTHDRHMEVYTEAYGLAKYGVFWFDYLYSVDVPEGKLGSKSSLSGESEDGSSNAKENSLLRCLIGSCTLNITSSLVHRVEKFVHCANNHEYEPYAIAFTEKVDVDKDPPTEDEVRALEEFIPTRTSHLTFLHTTINILAAEHAHYDVKKRKKSLRKTQKTKSSASSTGLSYPLPAIRFSADRFDLQVTLAMYVGKLVSTVSKMAGPSSNLLHHCYSHTQIKLFTFQVGLTRLDSSGVSDTVLTVVPPFSGALYKRNLLLAKSWQNLHIPHVEWMYEIPQLTVNGTKPQVLLAGHVCSSWLEPNPRPGLLLDTSLLEDTFRATDGKRLSSEPLLEVSVSGVELKQCWTPIGFSSTGTLSSLQAVLYSKVDGRDCVVPVLSAPSQTQHLLITKYFLSDVMSQAPDNDDEWITFTYQLPATTDTPDVPAVVLVEVGGFACCLDPVLYQWLLYSPRQKVTGLTAKRGADDTKIQVDLALAHAASPLNQSQMSVHSGSSVKDRSDSHQTPTNTQIPTQGQPQLHTPSSPAPPLSPSREHSRNQGSGNGHSVKDSGQENANLWGRICAGIFPLVRILQIQVEVSSCSVFMPKTMLGLMDAGMDIAQNVRGVFTSGTLPDTLVLALPSVRLHSCGFKPMSVLQEIPIPVLEGTLSGEKLPWSLQVNNFSVYTLHKMKKAFSILAPSSLSCTVALSVRYNPPTSENISSLGVCLHVDMGDVKVSLSQIQMQTVAVLCGQVSHVVRTLPNCWVTRTPSPAAKPKPDWIPEQSGVQASISFLKQTGEQSTSANGGEAVTTETSEELSRDTTPSRELEIEEENTDGVKLSFWLQWTLPKLKIACYGQEVQPAQQIERCVRFVLEDFSASIDIQEVYTKVKAKIGSVDVRHFVMRPGESVWSPGENEGLLLLSGANTLARNVQVVSNKLWTNDTLPSPIGSLYTLNDAMTRDKNHGLISFTFTRALCKNVKRRMQKLNVEIAGLHNETEASAQVQHMLANNYRKYISEVCLSLEPCDLVLDARPIVTALSVLEYQVPRDLGIPGNLTKSLYAASSAASLHLFPKTPLTAISGETPLTTSLDSKKQMRSPLFSSGSLPLMYVTVSNTRIFMPVHGTRDNSSTNLHSEQKMPIDGADKLAISTLNHDLFLLQFSSVGINPQADNPLPRYILEKDLYQRALHAGITQHPGSQLEDRQYQLDVKGLTFCSGVWKDFAQRIPKHVGQESSHLPSVQIPAVEWNNLVTPDQAEKDIRVIPLAARFDFKVVAAPAIVYKTPNLDAGTSMEHLVVCGHVLEINITSDMDFYLSTSQLNLLYRLTKENLELSAKAGTPSKLGDMTRLKPGEQHLHDSGVESDTSTATAHFPFDPRPWPPGVTIGPPVQEPFTIGKAQGQVPGHGQTPSKELTPLDVLVTAGRITCMLYSHKLQSESLMTKATSSGKKKTATKVGHSKTKKSDLEKKATVVSAHSGRYNGKKGSYRQPWINSGYLADESSDECEGTYDPSAHLRFMNIHDTTDSRHRSMEDSGVLVVPFLYCYFSQPHTVMSIQPDGEKIELSCYDVLIKGASADHLVKVDDHKLLPDCSDFSTHWLETRAGSPHLKTGVPPSLFTLKLSDFLHKPAQISVEFERPLRVSFSLSKLMQLQQFMADTVSLWGVAANSGADNPKDSTSQPDMKVSESDLRKDPPVLAYLRERLQGVEIHTKQVILHAETLAEENAPFVHVSMSSVSADASFQQEHRELGDEIIGNLFVKDIQVKTGFEKKSRSLIGPLTLNSDCVVQWCEHSGPANLPKVAIVMDIGHMILHFGQEHVMCFQTIHEHIMDYLKEQTEGKPQASQSDHMPKGDKSSVDLLENQRSRRRGKDFIVEHTTDDLKTGAFQYIIDGGEGLHPNPGEIVFGVESHDGNDTMTWSYSQPRVISHFSVSPVPFSVSEDGSSTSCSSVSKIPCTLQYWDVTGREFLDYREFYLSEDATCEVILPEVKPHVQDLIVALMWRVVMSEHDDGRHGDDDDKLEGSSTSTLSRSSSMVLPMSLAACIRVDSCFVPSLIPMLQLCVSASVFQLRLSNHLKHLGEDVPTVLQPFFVDPSSMPSDQEFAVVTLDNPAVVLSIVQGQQAKSTIEFSGSAQLDVVEYKFLSQQVVVESTNFHGIVTAVPENLNLVVDASLNTDPMIVRVGKGALHTLNCALQAWTQLLQDNTEEPVARVIFNHYVICNDTQQTIRFGQVGTDENLCVHSREMKLYSWRSHKMPQHFHMCLDGAKWQWCEPFNVSSPGALVRRVQTADQNYTLIVRVKQLSNVHTQVIFSGQLVVSSRLSQHMELKVLSGRSESNQAETSTVVGAEQTVASYILEEEEMRGVRFRLMGMKTMWSQDVFVTGDRMKDNRLVKIPLHDTGNSIHVWCRILHQQFQGARQTLVLLTPLYVVRTHLPKSLLINIETPQLKSRKQMDASGQGRELEVQCMGGDLSHLLTFQLGPAMPKSSPPVTLSTGLIDQMSRAPVGAVDVEQLSYHWSTDLSQAWPYFIHNANSNIPQAPPQQIQRSSMAPASMSTGVMECQPNIDLNVNLTEYWPGCSTLLVDIMPWCLLTNHSGLDLVVMATDEDLWHVPNKKTFAPPQFKDGLRLGVKDDEGIAVCSPVELSDEEWSIRRYRTEPNHTLYTDGFVHVTILLLRHGIKQVCMLMLKSSLQHGMRIITVRERFAVSNLTSGDIGIGAFAIPLGQKILFTETAEDFVKLKCHANSICSKPTTSSLLYWRVLPEEINGVQDFSFVQYLSLRALSPEVVTEKEGDKSLATDSSTKDEPMWACPLRISATQNGTRSTITLHRPDHSCLPSVPLVMTGHVKEGVTYLVIQPDKAPMCVIHNHCHFTLAFGQTLTNLSVSGCVVQEETELLQSLPQVKPGRFSHYTFPQTNTKFPEMYDSTNSPKLHFSLSQQESSSEGRELWSIGIDISIEQDSVLSIPGAPDVKVHVEKVAMVTHIVVDTVSKAEISAKEIRSRIRGKDRTIMETVIENKCDKSEDAASVLKVTEKSSVKSVLSDSRAACLAKPKHFDTKKLSTRISVSFGVFLKHFCVVMLDESSSEDGIGEVLRVVLDDVYLTWYPVGTGRPVSDTIGSVQKHCLGVCVGNMQIDNQLYEKCQYDFPVVLIRQNNNDNVPDPILVDDDFFDLTVTEKHAVLRQSSLIHLHLVQVTSAFMPGFLNESLEMSIQPLCLYVDDCFIYRLLREMEILIPAKMAVELSRPNSCRDLPYSVHLAASHGADPMMFGLLSVQPIRLLLSVHASLKVFIASDQTPLTFGKFVRHGVFTTGYQLVKALAMHYVSGAIFRAGLVVGSLDVLGNPTGLVRSIGNGVADLFRLPYAGITRSPGAFVSGVSNGMSSLLRNISAGTISSITNFASSVSRNMDRLSLDEDHFARQERYRKNRPAGLSSGIRQGLTGLGLSLLGAVAGLADQPIQGALHLQQPTGGATATATGIMSGMGKGLMGVVTKPIGGAAEFVSQTGQGILQSTGLVSLPEIRYKPVEELWTTAINSHTKHLWKILQSLPPSNCLLMELSATQRDAAGEVIPVILLLTTDILFVLSCEEDGQQQAFTVIELDHVERPMEPSLVTLVWRDSFHHGLKQDPSTDRVAEFVDKSSSFVDLPGLESSTNDVSQSESTPTASPDAEDASCPQYEFHVDPNYRDTFITLLHLTKHELVGQGFPS